MKTMKKLTAIVLAMLMVMSMGVFSSFAACPDDVDGNPVACVDEATATPDGLCDECGLPQSSDDADADVCECADGFVDAETPADGVCDNCGEDMPEESNPLDFFNDIIASIQGFIEQIVEFFQDFIDSIRGFGDTN